MTMTAPIMPPIAHIKMLIHEYAIFNPKRVFAAKRMIKPRIELTMRYLAALNR
jgi:hypothetical protein